MPTALITGVTGQDGSYLAELLLSEGYTVHGIVRRTSNLVRSRIEHLRGEDSLYGKRFFLHYADLGDGTTLRRVLAKTRPDEIYHLAGQSHVGLSFEIPESTCDEAGMATLRLLEIARDQPQPVRFYHASSSEIFGRAAESPQTEDRAFRPTSPYGCAKAFGTQIARVYRESYGLFVCNGFSTITSHHAAAKISSRERSREALRRLLQAWSRRSSSAASPAGGIGAMRGITCERCG